VQARALEDAMVRLQAMVTDLESRNEELSQEQEASADHLAKVYENMKPAQAAPIIAALEMNTILQVMSRMRERQAARILASMPPATAAIISAGLSQGGRG
jgi:flagellar motility protein MotE (MotC chaperone)